MHRHRLWKILDHSPSAKSAVLGAALALVACGGAPRATEGNGNGVRYTLSVDEELDTFGVRVCFDGAVPSGLWGVTSQTLDFVASATTDDGRELPRSGRTLQLGGVLPGRCVRYEVDVERIAGTGFVRGAARGEGVLFASSVTWLLMPTPFDPRARYELALDAPEGMRMSAPWERTCAEDCDRFRLDETAFKFLSQTVIGQFAMHRFDVDGVPVELARVGGPFAASDDDLRAWLELSVRGVARITGRFPAPRAQVAVFPTEPGHDPVQFGFVGRGGGCSVLAMVREDATLETLAEDWVLVHELSHLLLPYIDSDESWLSEGFATYYQEVVRARAGVRTPLEAWRSIDNGFQRGESHGTGRTLIAEAEAMHRTHAYWRVYWGGAAVAMYLDVALRRRGGSLDAALDRFVECCGRRTSPYSSMEAIRRIAELGGAPDLAADVERMIASDEFPDFETLYVELGLRRNEEGLVDFVDAPGSAMRDAIMAAP